MLDLPGNDTLPTWQVHAPPDDWSHVVPATRIADHRRHYLTFEGPVSGDRGSVRRVEEGTAQILSQGPAWLVRLQGKLIAGDFLIG
jgi:hypothetical protein